MHQHKIERINKKNKQVKFLKKKTTVTGALHHNTNIQ